MVKDFVYSDIDMELTKQNDGDITKDKDVAAILNSLSNIVSTLQGSRRMLPEFAQDLWGLLFEPMTSDTARAIGSQILEAVRAWDNRVDVTAINIIPDYDNNLYRVTMKFLIKPLRIEEKISFVLFSQ